MALLQRSPRGGVRRSGIVTKGSVARAIRAYRAGTGRGRITDDGGNLTVAIRFDCPVSSGLPSTVSRELDSAFCSPHGNDKWYCKEAAEEHGKTYTRGINGIAMTERSPYNLDPVQLEKAVQALQKAAETLRPNPSEERLYRVLGICVRVSVAAF